MVSTKKPLVQAYKLDNAYLLTRKVCIMDTDQFEIESKTLFSESLIWQLNRDFYQENGINAWSNDIVPHHMTSNSSVGKTYAELIFAFLRQIKIFAFFSSNGSCSLRSIDETLSRSSFLV